MLQNATIIILFLAALLPVELNAVESTPVNAPEAHIPQAFELEHEADEEEYHVVSNFKLNDCTSSTAKLNITGELYSIIGYRHEKPPFDNVVPTIPSFGKTKKSAFTNDAFINFSFSDRLDTNNEYGAFVRLHANASPATSGEDSNADKVMLYWQNDKIARFIFGSFPGASGLIKPDTINVARAAYGTEGFSTQWYSSRSLTYPLIASAVAREFLTTPNLPSNYSGFHYSDANKLTMITKPLNNATLAVSYIPDLDHTGTIAVLGGKNEGPQDSARKADNHIPTARNIITAAMQAVFENEDFITKLYLSGEYGRSKKVISGGSTLDLLKDIKAFEIGASVQYNNVKLSALYGNWGRTGTYKTSLANTKHTANYLSFAVDQEFGNIASSLTYLLSERAGGLESVGAHLTGTNSATFPIPVGGGNFVTVPATDAGINKYWHISWGLEYKLEEGVLPFFEISRFKFTEHSVTPAHSGTVLLTGIILRF